MPTEIPGGAEGGVIGACLGLIFGWFGNLLYMREKFIAKDQCSQCKNSAERSDAVQIKALEGRMVAVELCVQRLFEQSTNNNGMIREIHGWIKAKKM